MAALASMEHQDVERFGREFESLFYRGDFVAMASYYTEDAKLMVENQEIIQGREAIEKFWQMVCQMAGSMKRTIDIQEVDTSGNMGYMRSKVVTEVPTPDHQVITTLYKDVTIWKRDAQGRWLLAVDIANRDPSPQDAGI